SRQKSRGDIGSETYDTASRTLRSPDRCSVTSPAFRWTRDCASWRTGWMARSRSTALRRRARSWPPGGLPYDRRKQAGVAAGRPARAHAKRAFGRPRAHHGRRRIRGLEPGRSTTRAGAPRDHPGQPFAAGGGAEPGVADPEARRERSEERRVGEEWSTQGAEKT